MKNKNLIYYINLIILIIFLLLIYLKIIDINRLLYFIYILIYILIYKLIIYYIKYYKPTKDNKDWIPFLIKLNKFNKWRPFLLLFLLKVDDFNYNLIRNNNNKIIKILIFLLYLLLLNPIRIVLYKYYKFLDLLQNMLYIEIFYNRILGLILSVLIFTNIIHSLKNILGINIWILIYLFLLIICILNEFKYLKEKILKNKYLRNLIFSYNTISIQRKRLSINIISLIIDDIIFEYSYYFNSNEKEYFAIGSIWEDLNIIVAYKNKPDYELYEAIMDLIGRSPGKMWIVTYIRFQHCDWNKVVLYWVKEEKYVKLYYDILYYNYNIFKIYLFLIWDLEHYLGYDIKKSLKINTSTTAETYHFKLNNKILGINQYLELLKTRKEDKFFSNLNIDTIQNYDFWKRKADDSIYQIKNKEFDKYNKLVNKDEIFIEGGDDFNIISEILSNDKLDLLIGDTIYNKYIEEWYKEWLLEQHINKIKKYEEKLNLLEKEWNYLKTKLKKAI